MYGGGMWFGWIWVLALLVGMGALLWAVVYVIASSGTRRPLRRRVRRTSSGSASRAARSPSRRCPPRCASSMRPEVPRRRVLQVATLGAVATVAGGVGTWKSLAAPRIGSASAPGDGFDHASDDVLREPAQLVSADGVLEVDLTAGIGVTLAGRRTQALGYNGTSPGPTLRVAPGDVLVSP